ncbi:MAG: hypothetical protein V1763_00550, partial [Parcubacteria group bacterium]
HFTLTIRNVGELTGKLCAMKKGDTVFVRGPFGNGFPAVNKNLILVAGGCGFLPLRSVYLENKNRADIKIQLFIGCKNANSALFADELKKERAKHDLNFIFEQSNEKLSGNVTDLLRETKLLDDALVFICGPEPMYAPVVDELKIKDVDLKNVFVSLEKRMHCGVGICQHCACGVKYVCKDGPVFRWNDVCNTN